MDEEEVDVVGPKPSQALLHRSAQRLGAEEMAVHLGHRLGRDDHLVASTRQRPTYGLLGPVRAGSIDEVDAEIERSVDDGDRLVLAGPVGEPKPAVPTAAETGDRDGQPGASECRQLH